MLAVYLVVVAVLVKGPTGMVGSTVQAAATVLDPFQKHCFISLSGLPENPNKAICRKEGENIRRVMMGLRITLYCSRQCSYQRVDV
jgi:hypothetical protein